MDRLEKQFRVTALKKAALVMNELARTMKPGGVRDETKDLARMIVWAANYVEMGENV